MATRRRRFFSVPVVAGAKRPVLRQIQEGEVEQLPTTQPSDICTYWPPIKPSIPSGSFYAACSSSTKTSQSTCLSVTTLHAIINPWWNSAPFGGAGPSPSFSPTNKPLRWRIVCLLYATPCVSAGTVSSSSASGNFRLHTPPEARLSQAVCGHRVHKPDTTRHGLSGASFPHHSAAVASLY